MIDDSNVMMNMNMHMSILSLTEAELGCNLYDYI